MTACPKCYTEGKNQEMEPHLYSFHLRCPEHGWMAKSDGGILGAINEFKSRGCEPSGAAALQVVNPS